VVRQFRRPSLIPEDLNIRGWKGTTDPLFNFEDKQYTHYIKKG